MKNIYLSLTLLVFNQQIQAQIITIPNANFKNALINTMCVDTNGDGIYNDDVDTNNDNEIQIAEAEAILKLNVSSQNIASLEGIEQFTNLIELYCDFNQLTTLDVSKNHNLEILNCLVNNLTTLDVSNNSKLITLYCAFNQLTDLDVSNNHNLINFWCYTNQLTSLNLKNGNNNLLLTMFAQDNINLSCIQVDDVGFSNNVVSWSKNDTTSYSENCGLLGVDTIENDMEIVCYPNPVSNMLRIKTPDAIKLNRIKVYNTLGKLAMEEKVNFEQLDLSNLNQGLHAIIFEADNITISRKILKK
ncbi:T9SS type A sorting domain-containing protein [Flavivirga spongiicola]|uniref:T9SS type A sorting domain-containing protein n=1 Tax=Flavivirga spongiicola TaxID=421621 RepID=A0ABU7XWW9_9FLAO|nr:T9SS type A sorting domain-containing protein [Flavivirga sp. MEBiC05379]MDO5980273.1 T9SS type A sorting domain-containing protein [Flavivirga sp. MEBiC05379]